MKHGTVYVMHCPGHKWVRVGHHTTSDPLREKQVLGGSGFPYKIVFSISFKSKLAAAAAEAVAHQILSPHERKQSGNNGKKGTAQVFDCTVKAAECAVRRAEAILKKNKII